MTLSGQCVIAGIGATAFGKLPGRSSVSLNVEAIRAALADANVEKGQVDALFVKPPTSDFQMLYAVKIASALGIQSKMGGAWDQGGAANATLISIACMAIAAGQIDVAVVSFADTPRSGSRDVYARPRGDDTLYGWFGTLPGYAMIMQRHIGQHHTPPEAFGEIAIAARGHGATNPDAQVRNPLTMDDYLAADPIVAPLKRDDCTLISDGGGAVVIMSARRAAELGVAAPVPILGWGYGQTFWEVAYREDLTTTMAATSGATAMKMAGLTPDKVDCVQLYDCFTIAALMTLEDYGFCKKGQAADFVRDGALQVGGALPFNTSGGLLSETGMPGMQLIHEGVRQMRGTSVNPVRGARNVVISNQGGVMQTHSTLVLGQ
ncbi:thiolase family protein [Pseudooceanicola sp. LIPI14-2-Ac024]|uniref:thiolase family protein n=1 Tax=Pseudooceanicola sp. LIPI14-2-Ac024 TaxID=3344875 RepID=UPI0035D0828D